jgi:hypothetical protein
MSKPKPIAQVVAVEPAGPDGHGVNWLGGKPPKPGDLLYRAEDINRGCAGLREAAQNALVTLDGIADTNPRDTADFETPAEWIAWAKSRARWAADALRSPVAKEIYAERILKQMLAAPESDEGEPVPALTQATASEGGKGGREAFAGILKRSLDADHLPAYGAIMWCFDAWAESADLHTAQPAPAARPMPDCERDAAIDAKLQEYGYPANTRNAGRAGWYACMQAYGIGPQPTAPAVHAGISLDLLYNIEASLSDYRSGTPWGNWDAIQHDKVYQLITEMEAAPAVPAEFTDALRETAERSKAAPPGTLVQINPTVSAEFAKFQRGEPSAFDALSAAPATVPAVLEVSRAMLETLRNVTNNAVYVANNECALSLAVVKEVEAVAVRAESLLASAPTSTKGGAA